MSRGPAYAWVGAKQTTICLTGKRLRVFNDSWVVSDAQLLTDKQYDIFITGVIPDARPGKMYRVVGEWSLHKQYGWQLKVSSVRLAMPATCVEMQLFVGRLDGVGAINSKRMVDKHGISTIAAIKALGVEAFLQAGIQRAYAMRAMADFADQASFIDACEKLHKAGFRGRPHEVLLDKHRGNLVADVLANPGCILIPKVKFDNANQLWTLCGIAPDDPRRITCGLQEVLGGEHVAGRGHCWLDKATLVRNTFALFATTGIVSADILAAFDDPYVQKHIHCDPQGRVWCAKVAALEHTVCERLFAIAQTPVEERDMRANIVDMLNSADIELSVEQKAAIIGIPHNKVSLLTGSAGTGKSTVIKWLVSAFGLFGLKCKLCAYTGTAARLVGSKSGHQAHTVHRLLAKYGDDAPGKHEKCPLSADVVIIDEFSMMPLGLTVELLCALKNTTYVVIVGDPHQLPAIDQGAVLRDLINSECIPHHRLTTVYRQDGHILQFANSILQGSRMPILPEYKDIEHYNCSDPILCMQKVLDIWRTSKAKFLTHSWKHACGVHKINEAITEDLRSMGELRGGRKVLLTDYYDGMQCVWRKNIMEDDSLLIANGQDFLIERITQSEIIVRTDDNGDLKRYALTRSEYFDGDHFTPGYARTVHSAQGRGYPVVVFVVQPNDEYGICRECVYTAITRAEQKLIIIGDLEILYRAPSKASERRTGLQEKLRARMSQK